MKKRVVDLTSDELGALAAEAGAEAVRETLAAGVPVTGKIDGYQGISTLYPDGTIERFDPERNPRPAKGAAARSVRQSRS